MVNSNPYQAYGEGNILSGDPAALVVALYEGAIEAVSQAKDCLENGDIAGRGKAITKAMNIVTELMACLDHRSGGELSNNLQRLYQYIHKRLFDAHARKQREPLDEVGNLLTTLLDGWKTVAAEKARAIMNEVHKGGAESDVQYGEFPYGAYFNEPAGAGSGFSAVF